MDNSYYMMHIGALIATGFFWWMGGTIVSCYFPFLLSAKYYYVVKKLILCKIFLSRQLNGSSKSKTRIEDRNKLPIVGLIYYIIGTILLIVFWVSDFCSIITPAISEPSPVAQFLVFLGPYFMIGMVLNCILTSLL